MLRRLFPPDADWIVSDVVVLRGSLLGSGAFGEVFRATWKGSVVAAKKLHDIFFRPNVVPEEQCRRMVMEFVVECSLQAQLRHPNIVPLFGVFLPPAGSDGEQAPVMITELMAETLRGRVLRVPRLTVRDVVDAALQIVSALRFLHERPKPIAHRDLSANNVMLSFGGKCKIGDVGLAKVFTTARPLATTMKPGAEPYMPGEVLLPGARYNEKLDNFSLGVLILEMAVAHEPRPSVEFSEEEEVNGRVLHALIPETRRRQADLEELGRQHVLRPLVERLFESQTRRPVISEVCQSLEELCDSPEYLGSPSTLGSAEAVTSRIAGELRQVKQAVQELREQQATSEGNAQRLDESHRQQLNEVKDDIREVRGDAAMATAETQQQLQQHTQELQQQLQQHTQGLQHWQQELQQGQQQLQHDQLQVRQSVAGLVDSHRQLQDRLTRSHTQTDATLTRQQQAINTVEQRLDHLRRDVERSHDRLEQRMNAIACELLRAIQNVAESLRRPSSKTAVSAWTLSLIIAKFSVTIFYHFSFTILYKLTRLYYPGQKFHYSLEIHEVDPQFDHVISCHIELRFDIDATRGNCASLAHVADCSQCRMIPHDRTADQSHEYLGCDDFFGQGSSFRETASCEAQNECQHRPRTLASPSA